MTASMRVEQAPRAGRSRRITLCMVSTCGRPRGSRRALSASSRSHCQWRIGAAGRRRQRSMSGHVLDHLERAAQPRRAVRASRVASR